MNKVFFIKFFKKSLCNLTRGTHEMGKFKTVNELVNSLQPDYPVYCIRLNEIKKSVKFFKDNFPGKVLYAVKTNPNEKIIKQIILNLLLD